MNTSPSRRHLNHPKQPIQYHPSQDYGYGPPPPDRSPEQSRMAVAEGWHPQMEQAHHRHHPHHTYPPSDWPPNHPAHHGHYLPPPEQPSRQNWRSTRPAEHHMEPQYAHQQQQQHQAHHHHPHLSHHQSPPPRHGGHAKSNSRDSFLPPPLPPTMGPPSDRGSPPSTYESMHYPKSHSANHSRQPSPPRGRFENGEWGHKRKRSEGHDQYGPIDRSAWGPHPGAGHPHNGMHYHPDAPPAWGQPPPFYDADYGRMQPPAPKKAGGHNRHRSIDDPRMHKVSHSPVSPGHRNGLHPMGSPYDQAPRLPRATTEEVRRHPPSLTPGPVPRLTPPDMVDSGPHYQGGAPAHMPPQQQQRATSQHASVKRSSSRDDSAKQRSAEARRQKDAAKQNELAAKREHERQQREQQQQYEAEAQRAAAAPPVSHRISPPPPQQVVHHAPMHYEAVPPPLPIAANGQAYPHPQAPHPANMNYGMPPAPLHHGPPQAIAEHPMSHVEAALPPKDIYLEQHRGMPPGAVPPTQQPASLPVTRAQIISEPVWQWFDDVSSTGKGAATSGDSLNRSIGSWVYAAYKQPLLPGQLLSSNVGGLVEVRISGKDLGAYRETSDARAQLGWTLGWRARHHGVKVDVADAPLSAEAAAQLKPDAEVSLSLMHRKLWGSEVYTDDSDVLAMCVHSGWIEYPSAVTGEARKENRETQMYPAPDIKVTLRVAPRLISYKESYGGGIWSRNWYGRHDGVSLIVENVELQPRGYATASALPGHRGTKAGVAAFARMRSKASALSRLDQLAATVVSPKPGHVESGAGPGAPSAAGGEASILEGRKQSVFPLSDMRRGSEKIETAGKSAAAASSSGLNSMWWKSHDIVANRMAAVVPQKA